ncbi:MAG: Zn-ribbon domain-containing OB-fold protein [Myxococcota bacterium]
MAEPRSGRQRSTKPIPIPTPETQHFWDGTLAGELRLQRCDSCSNVYFPPRPFCPKCASRSVRVFAASGLGTLHSFVINQRAAPGSGFEAPYSIAIVELEEGPRMMTNIVDSPQTPEALVLNMPVEVTFAKLSDDVALPLFRPRDTTTSRGTS